MIPYRFYVLRLCLRVIVFAFTSLWGKVSWVTPGCVQERAVRRLFWCDDGHVKMARYILPVQYIYMYIYNIHVRNIPWHNSREKIRPLPHHCPLGSVCVCVCVHVLSYSWCTARSCQKVGSEMASVNCSLPCKGQVRAEEEVENSFRLSPFRQSIKRVQAVK
jgi:hypothetical protein